MANVDGALQLANNCVCGSKTQPLGRVPTVASSTCTQVRLGLPSITKEVMILLVPFLRLTELKAPLKLFDASMRSILTLFCKSKFVIPVALIHNASRSIKLFTSNVFNWVFSLKNSPVILGAPDKSIEEIPEPISNRPVRFGLFPIVIELKLLLTPVIVMPSKLVLLLMFRPKRLASANVPLFSIEIWRKLRLPLKSITSIVAAKSSDREKLSKDVKSCKPVKSLTL